MNMKGLEDPNKKEPKFHYKIFRVFSVIRHGEAPTALLLTVNVFLLLTAYYIIKPVRDALILAGKGPEWKSYLSAAQAVLLVLVIKIFSNLASKVPRQVLITWVTLFFISNLFIFYLLHLLGMSLDAMGVIFYIWVGIFSVMVLAQFWGFANDIYTNEAGKRLFPIIAFGATFGGFSGSAIAGFLVKPLGLYQMMLVAGGILGACILLTLIIHKREIQGNNPDTPRADIPGEFEKKDQTKPLEKGNGFRLVFKNRYLLFIALLVLLLNFVNSNGEYILSNIVTRTATEAVQSGTAEGLDKAQFIGKFYADFMVIFNLIAMFIQLFLVSRIFRWVGVKGALFVLPLIAFGGYVFIALGASLLIVKWAKALENGTDYSLMNTTRHALFLITSREEKYKAKAAIDTFFQRAGDILSALLVFIGTTYLASNVEGLAKLNIGLIIIWMILCVLIMKLYKRLSSLNKAPLV
ncbi:NTP/NDP exchange transporter [Acidobacteriota bacterium]